MTKKHTKPAFYRRKRVLWGAGIFVAVIAAVLIAFKVSPWPGALIIRAVFDNNSAKVLQALEKHTPTGVAAIRDQQYMGTSESNRLDVYYPAAHNEAARLPVIIWTHGGAWLSGDKSKAAPYYQLLASKGYVVIALNYTVAPSKTYPTQLVEINQAHKYMLANAGRFHADADKIFFAGDSAGSQLSAQLAAMITNSSYAKEVGIEPALKPSQLRGVVLNCGVYKMEGLVHPDPTLPKIVGWGDDVAVWAYAGTRDFSNPVIKQMSPYYHATKDFPPAFITGGNADPLTDAQSKPLAQELQGMGVPVTTLFYPADHQPNLPHEYQFNLDNADGQKALDAIVAFVTARSK